MTRNESYIAMRSEVIVETEYCPLGTPKAAFRKELTILINIFYQQNYPTISE